MNESGLLKFSLAGAIIGIMALYLITSVITVPQIQIKDISSGMVGTGVNISGEAKQLFQHKEGHLFFDLDDGTGEIKVVIWASDVKQLIDSVEGFKYLRNGDRLEIVGTVELYKGELEVIPIRNQIVLI